MNNLKSLLLASEENPNAAKRELLLYGQIVDVSDFENAGNFTRIYNMLYLGYKWQIKMLNGETIYILYVKTNNLPKQKTLSQALTQCQTTHEKIMCKTILK